MGWASAWNTASSDASSAAAFGSRRGLAARAPAGEAPRRGVCVGFEVRGVISM
jgi:hypothetical protein